MQRVRTSLCLPYTKNLISETGTSVLACRRQAQLIDIWKQINEDDVLKPVYPHIRHLISRTSEAKDNSARTGSESLDLADKTQLILQSSHPVRYIIQREIKNLANKTTWSPCFHDWVVLFGRSLLPNQSFNSNQSNLNNQLDLIGNAAGSGMFSSEIHQTIVNSDNSINFDETEDFHVGNKYAVLVGDFFSVRAIFFSVDAKCSQAILEITKGIENFTSAQFESLLIDRENTTNSFPYLLPSIGSQFKDWHDFHVRESGYFTGGLNAVLPIIQSNVRRNSLVTSTPENINGFVQTLAVFLHLLQELEMTYKECSSIAPFLFISLPALLTNQDFGYDIFQSIRKLTATRTIANKSIIQIELDEIRNKIQQNQNALAQSLQVLLAYRDLVKMEIRKISCNELYINIISDLIDTLVEQTIK